MFRLIPDWVIDDEGYWISISKRNFWFIKLRYAVVLILIIFLLTYKLFLNITISEIQTKVLIFTTVIILGYNIILHFIRKYLKNDINAFNPIHLSIVQMFLDLVMLSILVYYSGGVNSPIYFFFLFHMIVGSMILPGIIIYFFSFIVIIAFWSITIGSYYHIFDHHPIRGLLIEGNYAILDYVLSVNIIFAIVIIATVTLANSIAKQLYKKEQELFTYIDKLNQAEQEKNKYIMAIIHELKTPINAIHSYLDLVLKKFVGPLDDLVEEKLHRAKRRSDEAIDLINTVLKVSQMKLVDSISNEEIDIVDICKSAISQHEQSAKNKSISINFIDKRKNKTLKLFADKFLILISISNLISNAVKYGYEKGVIEICICDENNNLILEVCDDGAGIPENEQKNIFQDFFRASNIRKKVAEGAGLGLSFTKQIIEKHNGIITFQSPSRLQKPNQPGTSFKIVLPIK